MVEELPGMGLLVIILEELQTAVTEAARGLLLLAEVPGQHLMLVQLEVLKLEEREMHPPMRLAAAALGIMAAVEVLVQKLLL